MIKLELNPEWLYDSLHELVRMAFPGQEVRRGQEPGDAEVTVRLEASIKNRVELKGSIVSEGRETSRQESYPLSRALPEGLQEAKRWSRFFVCRLLEQHRGGKINSYGILTGMRPVKLVHKMLDRDQAPAAIQQALVEDYLLDGGKAGLLLEVALNNRPYLLSEYDAGRMVSLYLGIPYCPGRCIYCSFPGAVLQNRPGELDPFLQALAAEISTIGTCLRDLGYQVQSIYIGGGTPTVLSEAEMERLFDLMHDHFISPATREITVEAGRPDTLTPDKLTLMRRLGVDRICINPQTMNDITLQRIGRNHKREGVVRSFTWAREAGFNKINMDLIIGLPGEGLRENMYTAEQILKLQPENITVHTLALKRGSGLAESREALGSGARVEEVRKGVDYLASFLREADYSPYYLYRQKYMQASMENTGYSRPDSYCLYNIQMIEERQTIIGLGGGGASKFVHPGDWNLTSIYNPREPKAYCHSAAALAQRKVDKLRALN